MVPGYEVSYTKDSGGRNDLAKSLTLVRGISALYGFDTNIAAVYKWDDANDRWGAVEGLSGVTAGINPHITGSRDRIYFIKFNQIIMQLHIVDPPDDIKEAIAKAEEITHSNKDSASLFYIVRGWFKSINK